MQNDKKHFSIYNPPNKWNKGHSDIEDCLCIPSKLSVAGDC